MQKTGDYPTRMSGREMECLFFIFIFIFLVLFVCLYYVCAGLTTPRVVRKMLLPPIFILTGFAGFTLLETHQYVFTDDNTDAAGYRLFVRINPKSDTFGSGSIAFFQISHLGALDGGVATVARASVAEMAVDGIFIPFDAVWMRAGMTGAAASAAGPGIGL